MNEHRLKSLLEITKEIIYQNEELRKAKKEDFNIFEILKVERYEEHTHSAFIAELLKSDGSHLLGNVFLLRFLESIQFEGDFNTENYKVKIEQYIGAVNLGTEDVNFVDASGGRIDIFLKDNRGNCICIENKIYAGDQKFQMLRYSNYQLDKLHLYYLTLKGNEATAHSTNNILKAGEGYYTLSYRETILKWLKSSLKEAADHPILRENIKQYIIIIKKLTNLMADEQQEKLEQLIWQYAEEAEKIKDSFSGVFEKQREKVRVAIKDRLSEELPDFYIEFGAPTSNNFSQIWLAPKGTQEKAYWFGIESFGGHSGHLDGKLFIGVFDWGESSKVSFSGDQAFESNLWKTSKVLEFNKEPIIFSNTIFLKKTIDKDFFDKLTNCITEQVLSYVEEHKAKVLEVNKAVLESQSL